MHRTTLEEHFYLVTILPDFILDLYILSIGLKIICSLLQALRSLLAKFRFAAVISTVSATDKAKSEDFDP